MASVDVSPYVDLTLLDLTPGELLDVAVARLAELLPDLVLREGMTEAVMLEVRALIDSEQVYAINRLPGAIFEVLLRQFDVERDEGAPPTVDVTFHAGDALGHNVAAGTRVALALGDDTYAVFATDAPLVLAPGVSVGTVAATGTANGTAANGIAAGTRLIVIDAVPYVSWAATGSVVTDGRDVETDAAYLTRGKTTLARLNSTLVLAEQFRLYTLGNPAIFRALGIDQYDPALPGAPASSVAHDGNVTVAVVGVAGSPIDPAVRTALEVEMQPKAVGGLGVHVVDADVTAFDVDVTVRRLAAAAAIDVQAAVQAAIGAYLDPDTWPWRASLPYPDLSAAIDLAAGVDYVVDLATDPPGDPNGEGEVLMAGVAPLADAGVVTVTVLDPL